MTSPHPSTAASPSTAKPRRIAAIAASVVAVIAGSVVLAPVLHALLPFSFHVVFKRLLMVGALIVIVAFVRVRRETLSRLGLAPRADSLGHTIAGFAGGVAGLIALVGVALLWGGATIAAREFTAWKWAVTIGGGVLAGLLLGPIEEFVFRGVLFTWLRDRAFRGRVWAAVVATSAVYALLHFVDARRPPIGPDPGVMDALRLLSAPFRATGDWSAWWPAAVGLFLFGLVLNLLLLRTGSLYASIGLHAGCVVVLRLVPYVATFATSDVLRWGTKRIYDGMAGWIAIVLIGVVLIAFVRPASGQRAPGDRP